MIEDAEHDGETITGPEGGRSNLPLGMLCMVLGCFVVYSALFGAGYWIYGNTTGGLLCAVLLVVSAVALAKLVAALWRGDRALG